MRDADTEIVLQTQDEGQEVDFTVDSTDAAAQCIEEAGGEIVQPAFDIQIGRCVVVQDPWVNSLVLLDTSKGIARNRCRRQRWPLTLAMNEPPITAHEFAQRLGALCLSGVKHNLPKKQRDRHILFRSVAQTLDATRRYSEPELNAALGRWLLQLGIGIDHVTLRRHLVDEGYLIRDRQGSAYEVSPGGQGQVEFEA